MERAEETAIDHRRSESETKGASGSDSRRGTSQRQSTQNAQSTHKREAYP